MKANSGIDGLQLFTQTNYFPNRAYGDIHTFYLSGNIEEPEKYISWFDTIRNAKENDVIYIAINSRGGDIDSTLQFLKVIGDTKANVVASVEGACMSAATMIFLAADMQEITDHSMFMFHNYSGGTIGKGGEMADQIMFERKWSEEFMNFIYENFLSESEINNMLDGKDYWMTASEVAERLEIRAEKMKRKAEKELRSQKRLEAADASQNKKVVKPTKAKAEAPKPVPDNSQTLLTESNQLK